MPEQRDDAARVRARDGEHQRMARPDRDAVHDDVAERARRRAPCNRRDRPTSPRSPPRRRHAAIASRDGAAINAPSSSRTRARTATSPPYVRTHARSSTAFESRIAPGARRVGRHVDQLVAGGDQRDARQRQHLHRARRRRSRTPRGRPRRAGAAPGRRLRSRRRPRRSRARGRTARPPRAARRARRRAARPARSGTTASNPAGSGSPVSTTGASSAGELDGRGLAGARRARRDDGDPVHRAGVIVRRRQPRDHRPRGDAVERVVERAASRPRRSAAPALVEREVEARARASRAERRAGRCARSLTGRSPAPSRRRPSRCGRAERRSAPSARTSVKIRFEAPNTGVARSAPSRIARERARHEIFAARTRRHRDVETARAARRSSPSRLADAFAAEQPHQRPHDAPRHDQRAGRISRQADDGLAVADGEHRRLAGLDRDPVDEHAGRAESRDDLRGQIADRNRRAGRQTTASASLERVAQGALAARRPVVGHDPARRPERRRPASRPPRSWSRSRRAPAPARDARRPGRPRRRSTGWRSAGARARLPRVTPSAASPPTSAARRRRPAGTATAPARTSSPTVSTFSPGAAAASTSTSLALPAGWRLVSSTITTASAPRGSIAPGVGAHGLARARPRRAGTDAGGDVAHERAGTPATARMRRACRRPARRSRPSWRARTTAGSRAR